MHVIVRRTLGKSVFERGESAPNWGSYGGLKIARFGHVWPPISHNSVTPVPSFSRDWKTFLPSMYAENLKEFSLEDFEKCAIKVGKNYSGQSLDLDYFHFLRPFTMA